MKGSNRILRWGGLVLVTALLSAVVQCGRGGPEVVTESQARRLLNGYLDFRNKGDLAAANAVIHPDCVINYPNVPGYIKGLDALKEYNRVTRIAFPDLTMSVHDFFVAGDRIVSYWSMSGTNSGPLVSPVTELPPTNKAIRVTGIAVSRVTGGKILEDVAYFDTADMLKQLGFRIMPPVAQTE